MVSPNWQGNKLSVAKNSYLSIDGDMLSTATCTSVLASGSMRVIYSAWSNLHDCCKACHDLALIGPLQEIARILIDHEKPYLNRREFEATALDREL